MEDQPIQAQPVKLRGKDLPGAINVLPAGLGDVLKKRESREFHSEQTSNSMTFSTKSSGGSDVTQTFMKQQQHASAEQKTFSSTQEQQFSAVRQEQKSFGSATTSSSVNSFSSSAQKTSSMTSSSSVVCNNNNSVMAAKPIAEEHHGEEIRQESLKSTIQSAITDLEQDLTGIKSPSPVEAAAASAAPVAPSDPVPQEKENVAPTPSFDQVQANASEVDSVGGMAFKQNGLFDAKSSSKSQHSSRLKFPREYKPRPESLVEKDPWVAPTGNQLPDMVDTSREGGGGARVESLDQTTTEVKQSEQYYESNNLTQTFESQQSSTTVTNGEFKETTQLAQAVFPGAPSVTNNPSLEKALRPAPSEDYDTSSLKRRNPRQMFTDSSFYSPKFHPSVAEQVEMAHRLSSSLYEDGNKMSKGQEMYMKRAKKSGDSTDLLELNEPPKHDKVPNLKLVMNPEGKLHDWTDLPEEEVPEMAQVATGGNPDAAHAMVENLQACKGRGGELFAKRRKKADKWVVDEQNVGSSTSQFASSLLNSEFSLNSSSQQVEEVDACTEEQYRLEQQEAFQQQQLAKQQQSMAMRQERSTTNMNGNQGSVELPPNFKPCSLKGRPFTPTFDTSCHNTQGIDVWANKGPRPYAPGKSSTLPRNLGQARAGGQLPPAVAQAEKKLVSSSQEVKTSQQTTTVTSSSQQVVQETSSSSMTAVSASSQEMNNNSVSMEEQKRLEYEQWLKQQQKEQQMFECSVKYEEKAEESSSSVNHQGTTKTQDEVDRAAVEAQMLKEQEMEKLRIEEEKRLQEQKMKAEEEQRRIEEEQQREREIAEQKRLEEEQRQRMIEEQQQREEEERARKEQELREQQEREQRERERQEQQAREEQERLLREQQEREQKEQMLREQQERERQEQLMREQQMKEQQMKEQQMREQQMREQQMREQQMQEQQMREQQMREQQMQQQQMMMQQQTVQSQSMSSTTTRTEQTSLHKSEISMQMKSGGMLNNNQNQQFEDYTGSLRPTTTGSLIRQTGDVIFTQAGQNEQEMEQVELRPTSKGNVKDNIRQSGVFVGIVGDNNSLINDMANFDYEKHSVRELVGHFSKIKGAAPQQMFPQHYQVQNNATPSLSQLQDQAKSKQFSYQQTNTSTTQQSDKLQQEAAEERLAQLSERKNSLKSFLLMEEEMKKLNGAAAAGQILDPSAILQVDGSLTQEISAARGPSRGRELDSQGRLNDTNKWDNHNAIASGWKTVESNYRPVTFRKIYGVNKQAPTPVPTMQRNPSTPRAVTEPIASQPVATDDVGDTAQPEELQPDCSDL